MGTKAAPGRVVVSKLCEWDVPGKPSKIVIVGLLDASGWDDAKVPKPASHVSKTAVSGLGDDAVFVAGDGLGTLNVKKGSVILNIHLYGFPIRQIKEKEITLAREALANL